MTIRISLADTQGTAAEADRVAAAPAGAEADRVAAAPAGAEADRVAAAPAGAEGDQKTRDRLVAAKRVATIARNKEADRLERMAEIERQVSDGSLVIRQMTAAERAGAVSRRH